MAWPQEERARLRAMIVWRERRDRIATELFAATLAALIQRNGAADIESAAQQAVQAADALIEKLDRTTAHASAAKEETNR